LKKIVLITSGQPSLNPRLVKEADVLLNVGYEVAVIYQYWNDWGTKLDEELLANKKWKAIRVGGSPNTQKSNYWITRSIHKTAISLAKILGFKHGIAELAIGRCTWLLYNKALKYPADIYIAHNLAALPAAIKAAHKNKAKCGFDAEDFHRNEVSNNPKDFDVRIKSFIEEKYFPKANYVTASSPLITQSYQELFPNLFPIVTLLNVFPKTASLQIFTLKNKSPISLFWFSQTIGIDRGIEEIIKAMGKCDENQLELHLLGNHNQATIEHFNHLANQHHVNNNAIKYYAPISAEQIFSFASQFDIGMATETGVPYNRDICLTNKLFTYIQSGLAIIASDTKAQKKFIQQYPQVGKLYAKRNIISLAETLDYYVKNRHELLKNKQDSLSLSQRELNWETKSSYFLEVIKNTLSY
jgi:hypothetical protein